MTMDRIDDWALHAYVDGEVSDEQRAEIEAHLRGDAEARARVEAWRAQSSAIRQAYAGVLDEPVPAHLLAAVKSGATWRARPYLAMAASLGMLMIGAAGGYYAGHDSGGVPLLTIADRAISAYEVYTAEVKHPVEVAASDKDHLQAWLSKRIGTAFVVPDLTADGYALLGGRLLAADGKPAAMLMYEDANKKRLTIYLTGNTANSETAVRVEEKGALIACYWLGGPLGIAVAGEMDRDDMMKLARDVYDQLEAA